MPVPDGLKLPLHVGRKYYDQEDQLFDDAGRWVHGDNHDCATPVIADYIALAVNNHEKLVELLERIGDVLGHGNDYQTFQYQIRKILASLTPAPESPEEPDVAAELADFRERLGQLTAELAKVQGKLNRLRLDAREAEKAAKRGFELPKQEDL